MLKNIIRGTSDKDCVYGGMRSALIAFDIDPSCQRFPHSQDMKSFISAMIKVAEYGIPAVALKYMDCPRATLFTHAKTPAAFKTKLFKEYAARLHAYVKQYEEKKGKEEALRDAAGWAKETFERQEVLYAANEHERKREFANLEANFVHLSNNVSQLTKVVAAGSQGDLAAQVVIASKTPIAS